MKLKLGILTVARILVFLEIIALAVSTAATSVVEILIFVTVLGAPSLRARLFASLKQPMVVMALVLYAMVGLGILYSVVPFSEGLDAWGSWRKYLLLPFVVALFDETIWKQRFAVFFIGLMTLAAILSISGYLLDFTVYRKFPVGVIIDNHATQGIFFSAAVFTCMVLIKFSSKITIPSKWIFWVAAGILAISILFVTPGRSGYLAFMVYGILMVFFNTKGFIRITLTLIVPFVVLTTLMMSPVANDRIKSGFSEMQTYEEDAKITSMGVRIIFWKNTLTLLRKMEHPIFGYGTNGFKAAYSPQVEGQTGWQGQPTDDPHNQFLKIWVENGLVGLFAFLLFIATFFRQNVPQPYYHLGIGVVLAWCATSMFSGHFTTFHDGRFILVWTGVMLAWVQPKETEMV